MQGDEANAGNNMQILNEEGNMQNKSKESLQEET